MPSAATTVSPAKIGTATEQLHLTRGGAEVVTNGNGCAGTGGSGSGAGEPAEAARERRLRLDQDQLALEERIDDAVVDVEVACEERSEAEQAVSEAEIAAAAAIERLLAERLAMKDVVQLTGLDQSTVRRLRQLGTRHR